MSKVEVKISDCTVGFLYGKSFLIYHLGCLKNILV